MTAKSIMNMFEDYRKARISFVQTVADLALRQSNIEVLKTANVVHLLRPLLGDICVQIQQCAAVALGRLAHHDADIAASLLKGDVLQLLLKDINKKNKFYKKSAMFAMRAICAHDENTANEVIQNGGLEALIYCLGDYDADVKESATWATGYVARHNYQLARAIVDAGAIPHLVLCLQEPALHVRRIVASALSDIAKHGPDLAQNITDAGAVAYLAKCITSRDDKLKRQALMALSSIARHSIPLAEMVVQADVFPAVLFSMGHACNLVRRNSAMLIRDIVKHCLELAQLVANMGGVGSLVQVAKDEHIEVRIPAITALGYIAGHCSQLATCLITCDAITTFSEIVCDPSLENETELLCVVVWGLGQIARHCPTNVAKQENLLPRLLYFVTCSSAASNMEGNENEINKDSAASVNILKSPLTGEQEPMQELKSRCKATLRQCIQGCNTIAALEPLLYIDCPPDLIKHVLTQFAKILPRDPRSRRLFVTSGGLARVQEIEADPGSSLMECITQINACFPDEIVRYYTPGYPDTLLEKIEQFVPHVDILEPYDLDSKICGPVPSATDTDLLEVDSNYVESVISN